MASFIDRIKMAYVPLMNSFFLGTGANAMDDCLDDAIIRGDTEMVNALLDAGAEVTEKSLPEAIKSGSSVMVDSILQSSRLSISDMLRYSNAQSLLQQIKDASPELEASVGEKVIDYLKLQSSENRSVSDPEKQPSVVTQSFFKAADSDVSHSIKSEVSPDSEEQVDSTKPPRP